MTRIGRPLPTPVMHFTHVGHLTAIIRNGLLADNEPDIRDLLRMEVGDQRIKKRRRERPVRVPPGGVVADYVPFYFAPRSPMMYSIEQGKVPTYLGGCDQLVYLVSTVERMGTLGLNVVFTDRNAVYDYARFGSGAAALDQMVDWELMNARMWANTADDTGRKERRMAECLVHRRVPWDAFTMIVVRNQACLEQTRTALGSLGRDLMVGVRPGWYF